MAERRSAPRKVEVDTSDETHKKRDRIWLVVMLVGAVAIIAGMVLVAKFLSNS